MGINFFVEAIFGTIGLAHILTIVWGIYDGRLMEKVSIRQRG